MRPRGRAGPRLGAGRRSDLAADGAAALKPPLCGRARLRLFVAVWPPPVVVSAIAALARPDIPGLRWTPPDQWHATLVFLGDRELDEVARAFHRISLLAGPATATLGPRTERFGRRIVHVPIAGLDDVAASVRAVLPGEDDRPFRGHLTLARARDRRGADLSSVVGLPVSASFLVDEVSLVASRLGGGPARYEVVERRRW